MIKSYQWKAVAEKMYELARDFKKEQNDTEAD